MALWTGVPAGDLVCGGRWCRPIPGAPALARPGLRGARRCADGGRIIDGVGIAPAASPIAVDALLSEPVRGVPEAPTRLSLEPHGVFMVPEGSSVVWDDGVPVAQVAEEARRSGPSEPARHTRMGHAARPSRAWSRVRRRTPSSASRWRSPRTMRRRGVRRSWTTCTSA